MNMIDATAPMVTSITRLNPSPTNLASVDFTVTFSEAVSGVDTSDFALTASGVSGAAVSGFSGSGSVYTVTVNTGTGVGTIRLDVPTSATVTDLAGNPLAGLPYTSGETYTVDTTAPMVTSITRLNPNPTNLAIVDFTVTFSEAVTGVDTSDFALTASGVSGAAVSGFTGSGSVYTVTVNTVQGNGTLRLDVPTSATVTDLAGNPLAGLPYTSGETYTVEEKLTGNWIYLPQIRR